MPISENDAARANGNGAGDQPVTEPVTAVPTPEELAAAPVVAIEAVHNAGSDPLGETVRIAVQTATQGIVQLHFEVATLGTLIEAALAAQNAAFKSAQRAGKPQEMAYFVVKSFGVGELTGLPKVMMHINMGEPAERLYVFPEAGGAIQLAQALIKQAGINTRTYGGVLPPTRKLILPGHH